MQSIANYKLRLVRAHGPASLNQDYRGKQLVWDLERDQGWFSGNVAIGNVNIVYSIFLQDGIRAHQDDTVG